MLSMNVFKGDAFSATSMTAAVNKVGYVPGFLGGLAGLTDPKPVRTADIFIEERAHLPALIQTSARGAPPKQEGGVKRKVRPFRTERLADASRITASELEGIRTFGSETELKSLQVEIAERQAQMRRNLALTEEHMLLGMVQGKFVDADGSILYDWATEFDQSIPAAIDLDLTNTSPDPGALRMKCNQIKRGILRSLQGLGGVGVTVTAIAGDELWDTFTNAPEVRETFLNQQEAAELRGGNAWETFHFGGIDWTNYRGTDDGTTVAVADTEAKIFPVGAGIFQKAIAPTERFGALGSLGQEVYSWVVLDNDRDMWADVEIYSYPLYVCVQPSALRSAVLAD